MQRDKILTHSITRRAALGAIAAGSLAPVLAAPSKPYRVVQIADTTASRKALTAELHIGMMAHFSQVNQAGGIGGRQIALEQVDDKYEVKNAVEAARSQAQDKEVLALACSVGTAISEALLPIVSEARLPLVGPLSGASSLREPFNRAVFHVRASYAREVEVMVEHAHMLGYRRIAIFHDDDPFGADVLRATQASVSAQGLQLVAQGKVAPGSKDVAAAVQQIAAAAPEIVICGSFGASVVEFILQMKKRPAPPQFYALSFFTVGAAVRQLGPSAAGVVVTQVMPSPKDEVSALQREYRRALERFAPEAAPGYISLEGFVTAKVLTEGIRRAGANVTRHSLITGLESLRDVDFGGMSLTYGPNAHEGFKRVEITMVGGDGRIVR